MKLKLKRSRFHAHRNVLGDYKLCEQLHKFIGKSKAFSTHLAAAHSTCGSRNVLTSLDFADMPAKHDSSFLHLYSVGLNSPPYSFFELLFTKVCV
jgi:hypothetical protein